MLNEALAQTLIEELGQCTEYPIHIINESGIILASSDQLRIGTVHDQAFEMLQTGQDIIENLGDGDNCIGSESGISMVLHFKKKKIGAISITGDLESLHSVVLIVRKSAELIIENELNRISLMSNKNAKSQMLSYLMYAEINHLNYNRVKSLCKALRYREDLPRIPIILSSCWDIDSDMFYNYYKESVSMNSQDIVTRDEKGNIVLFLTYTDKLEGFFSNYQYLIRDFLKNFLICCETKKLGLRISTGPMETTWANYKFSYEKALWIHYNIKENEPGEIYFYEHMDEYLKSKLPLIELHQIFDVFIHNLNDQFINTFVEHIGVLYENNYSFQKSSDELYIHKNTFAFRMDKIRSQLGADPIRNTKDRELLEYFYYYLIHIHSSPIMVN